MMVKLLLLLAAVAVVTVAKVNVTEILEMEEQWLQWKEKHGKNYPPKEEVYRRTVFNKNFQTVNEHNAKYPAEVTFTMALNKFADMTKEEYWWHINIHPSKSKVKDQGPCSGTFKPSNLNLGGYPKNLDWRTKGYVTPVRNGLNCPCYWAFSAAGAVEGQHFNKTGKLITLSVQQIVDCDHDGVGCQQNGDTNSAFGYIMKEPNGLESDKDYPFVQRSQKCASDPNLEQAPIRGCVNVERYNEYALQYATWAVGPISVKINASPTSFQFYSNGKNDGVIMHLAGHAKRFKECKVYFQQAILGNPGVYMNTEGDCYNGIYDVNLSMLVVGYGRFQDIIDYWIVKNSWGTDWGMDGYILMTRNMFNMCGIATKASYPVV